ncbi:MAG: transporter substrate-binding domain-containing protein [Candidatus Rokubacteria bacterium]|nr:transporter substrate-binding domain-containing protein [Candidatus Rokubacteria bacterium]MBI3105878.1 transporter substrate-binding domain-containing protein [Candidatus Rokubacteria bacterium]
MKRSHILAVMALAVVTLLTATGLAAAESTLEVVKKRGTLVAGVKADYPPFGYTDKDGKVVGFDIDIMQYLAKKLGVQSDLRPVTSANRIPMLQNSTVDVLAASFTITLEREKVVDFTIPYFVSGGSFLIKKGSRITGYASLAGRTVTFTQGTPWEKKVLQEQPKAKVLVFQDKPQAVLAVKQGKADAYVDDDVPLYVFAKDHPELQVIPGATAKAPMGIAVRENDSAWRDFINFTLIEMWEDGTYKALHRKHFGVDPDRELKIYPWKL